MTRGLATFAFVACVLSAAAACGAPSGEAPNPNPPQAQATSVRRTEVADVQRIIANNPAPTSTPAPSPVAPPTCQADGAIWWYEARAHVGESRTVQGMIVASRPAPAGFVLLEVGQRYPDPTGLTVLMPADPASRLDGKTVCVAGQITTLEGRPTIQLRGTSNMHVMN
ncbi:MAG: hypothetical protein ACR2IK_25565 [Chloroflexota bacterium]